MDTTPASRPDQPLLQQPDSEQPFKRHRCGRSTTVRLLAKPSFRSYRASVHDVSRREIGLLIHRAFEPGTVLAIQLQTKNAGISGILSARVKQAIAQADGYWLLDCTLSRILTEEEVFMLV
jgi:hypothetical protein